MFSEETLLLYHWCASKDLGFQSIASLCMWLFENCEEKQLIIFYYLMQVVKPDGYIVTRTCENVKKMQWNPGMIKCHS